MSDKTFKRSARRILERLGQPCVLTKHNNGGSFDGYLVHISRDVEVVSPGNSETTELRNEAEMLVEDVGDLKKRDVIDTGAEQWTVAKKIANDGYTIRVIVSEE